MQIFKHTLLACSLVAALGPATLRAEDNEAQAAARAALQQKMRELHGGAASEAQPATTVVVPAQPVAPAAPAAPVAPAPVVVSPNAVSPDLIEQARQATRARLQELQGNSATAIPAGSETPAPAKEEIRETRKQQKEREAAAQREAEAQMKARKAAAQPVEANAFPQTAPETATVTTTVKPAEDPKEIAKRQKAEAKAQAEAEKAAAKRAAQEAKEAKKAKNEVVEKPAFTPMEVPASNLSGSKEQRLQQLNDDYRTDKISAEEYHQSRAKILSEP